MGVVKEPHHGHHGTTSSKRDQRPPVEEERNGGVSRLGLRVDVILFDRRGVSAGSHEEEEPAPHKERAAHVVHDGVEVGLAGALPQSPHLAGLEEDLLRQDDGEWPEQAEGPCEANVL